MVSDKCRIRADSNTILEGHQCTDFGSLPGLRERKVKGRALAYFSLRPDPAAVPLDGALDDCQDGAGPIILPATVQRLEGEEQIIGITLHQNQP